MESMLQVDRDLLWVSEQWRLSQHLAGGPKQAGLMH